MLEKIERIQQTVENNVIAWARAIVAKRRKKNEGRALPSLKDIRSVRNYVSYVILILMTLPVINTFTGVFNWENEAQRPFIAMGIPYIEVPRPWYAGLDIYAMLLVLWLLVFFFVFDYSLWKRGGKDWSVIDYGFSWSENNSD